MGALLHPAANWLPASMGGYSSAHLLSNAAFAYYMPPITSVSWIVPSPRREADHGHWPSSTQGG